jgi:mannan endo-1,4-beta-mannosidase
MPTAKPCAPLARWTGLAALLLALLPAAFAWERTLSNPESSPEAKALQAYLCSLEGKGILAGQQEVPHPGREDCDELNYIKATTGKLPAVLGLDYIDYQNVTERALDWSRRGGIVSLCWHWGAPGEGMGFEASQTKVDLDEVLRPGSKLNQILIADLDRTAGELTRLRDAGVPVLWRPFHEMNGGWFWWGKAGPEPFKALWKLMYERYTKVHHLNNLIWVLGFTSKPDAAWYPGDAYVDIAGADEYKKGTHPAMYSAVTRIVGKSMPVPYHECGPIPDPEKLSKEGPAWAWFLTWHTIHVKTQNTPEYLKQIYTHPYVITLDKLPKFESPLKPNH